MNVKKTGSPLRVSWKDLLGQTEEVEYAKSKSFKPIGWFRTRFDDELLRGAFEVHRFESGVRLLSMDLQVERSLEIMADQEEPTVSFVLVKQGSSIRTFRGHQGLRGERPLKEGVNIAGAYHVKSTSIIFSAGQRHRLVNLRMAMSCVPELIYQWEDQLSGPLTHILPPSGSTGIALQKRLSPVMSYLAHQILECSHERTARRLFMEAKALEVLACEIQEFSEEAPSRSVLNGSTDVERIHHARRILEREFDDPPTLLALARRVGLNDFKLKRGFREVLGSTVFGYVRQLRMERARYLLDGGLSVTEAAVSVGYKSFSHFADAFKRSVGVLPSHYRSIAQRSRKQAFCSNSRRQSEKDGDLFLER